VIGDRLGPYEVLAKLGEGGMGQVFRARDTKLNRNVALKVLPDSFAGDPDRLARFTREAQTLASLNHPNIAHIHGLEESGRVRALVMELVEGEDLSQRIARGPIPIDDALPIAKQIAEALEAAHEQGIIHRDLKPANIKVRADGTVKVLDFGLAKALDVGPSGSGGAGGPGASSMSPTLSIHATQAGIILGTAAYMAPEQAKGRAVDKRADIWAFGVVLHEMLTGRRLFEDEDISETLAAVLTRDVSTVTLPAATPPRVQRLLARCLERDPRMRLRDIGEARVEIDKAIAGVRDDASGAIRTNPDSRISNPVPVRRRALPWAIAAAAIAAASTALWARRNRRIVRSCGSTSISATTCLYPLRPGRAAASRFLPMVRGWPTSRGRQPGCSSAGSISRRRRNCRVRKVPLSQCSHATDSGWDSWRVERSARLAWTAVRWCNSGISLVHEVSAGARMAVS